MVEIKEVPSKAGRFERVGSHIHAKGLGKDTDVNEFRKRLQEQYPGAQMEIEGKNRSLEKFQPSQLMMKKREKAEKGNPPEMRP